MPNATRFAHWFRFASRFVPALLLVAEGLTMPRLAAQDAAPASPAVVLRVARDQPRLDTPRPATERHATERHAPQSQASQSQVPQSSRRTAIHSRSSSSTTGDGGSADRLAARDAVMDDAVTSGAAANDATLNGAAGDPVVAPMADDGWVTRGAIRWNLPLSGETPAAASPLQLDAPPVAAHKAASAGVQDAGVQDAGVQEAGVQHAAAETGDSVVDRPRQLDATQIRLSGDQKPEIHSSNVRSRALQEQNERFEEGEAANAPSEDRADEARGERGQRSRFVEIIPESLGTSGADEPDTNELPRRDPVIEARPTRNAITAERPAGEAPANAGTANAGPANAGTANAGTADDRPLQDVPAEQMRRSPAPVISAAALRLQRPLEQCLQYYHQRPEDSQERTPWGMLHAILPYGLDATVDAGHRRFNAIAWLAGNNPCRNLKLLTVSTTGRLEARIGVGLQGHQAQFLAILAQVGVPKDYPLYVGNRRFTVADLVESEMAACRVGEELTFTLIGLSHYLSTETTWISSDGQRWDFEKLIRSELQQPVVGAACGGTHRLMGFSYALAQRRGENLPETGQWERAAIFIDDFVAYAWQLQNRDGSLSTQWFEGAEDNSDLDRKVQTTGHILEWLVFNATDEQLQEERLVRGITFLTNAMISNRGSEWQVGPKGHALRALSLYHRRVFHSQQPWRANQTAATTGNGRR